VVLQGDGSSLGYKVDAAGTETLRVQMRAQAINQIQ